MKTQLFQIGFEQTIFRMQSVYLKFLCICLQLQSDILSFSGSLTFSPPREDGLMQKDTIWQLGTLGSWVQARLKGPEVQCSPLKHLRFRVNFSLRISKFQLANFRISTCDFPSSDKEEATENIQSS